MIVNVFTFHHVQWNLSIIICARTPLSLQVTVVKGDVYNPEEVSSAIQGCEGVLAALGRGWNMSATTLFSEGTRNIVAGMKEHGVRRIVICSSAFIFDERLDR